jgi:hypothetical protein
MFDRAVCCGMQLVDTPVLAVCELRALKALLGVAQLAAQGTQLPGYVEREFEDYLKCGRLEHGFLRVRCDGCHAEHLVAFS